MSLSIDINYHKQIGWIGITIATDGTRNHLSPLRGARGNLQLHFGEGSFSGCDVEDHLGATCNLRSTKVNLQLLLLICRIVGD